MHTALCPPPHPDSSAPRVEVCHRLNLMEPHCETPFGIEGLRSGALHCGRDAHCPGKWEQTLARVVGLGEFHSTWAQWAAAVVGASAFIGFFLMI